MLFLSPDQLDDRLFGSLLLRRLLLHLHGFLHDRLGLDSRSRRLRNWRRRRRSLDPSPDDG